MDARSAFRTGAPGRKSHFRGMDLSGATTYFIRSFLTEGGWIAAVGTARQDLVRAFVAPPGDVSPGIGLCISCTGTCAKGLTGPDQGPILRDPGLLPGSDLSNRAKNFRLDATAVAGLSSQVPAFAGMLFPDRWPRGNACRQRQEKSESSINFSLDAGSPLWQDPQSTLPDGVSGSLKTEQRHQYASVM